MPSDSFASSDWLPLRLRFNHYGRSPKWPDNHSLSREWFKRVLVDFTFWFFFSGKGELIDHGNNRSYPLHAGVCLCMLPGMDLEVRQFDPEYLGDTYFHIDFFLGEQQLPQGQWPQLPFYSRFTDIRFFDQTGIRILALLHQNNLLRQTDQESLLAAELLLKGLFLDLLQNSRKPTASGTPLHRERTITATLNALFADPRQFHSVARLAEFSGYSEGHFRSLCQEIMGESPNKILVRARIEQAKKYLLHSDLSIGMIADTLGYENIYHFSRQFRTVTGITANEFRKHSPK